MGSSQKAQKVLRSRDVSFTNLYPSEEIFTEFTNEELRNRHIENYTELKTLNKFQNLKIHKESAPSNTEER